MWKIDLTVVGLREARQRRGPGWLGRQGQRCFAREQRHMMVTARAVYLLVTVWEIDLLVVGHMQTIRAVDLTAAAEMVAMREIDLLVVGRMEIMRAVDLMAAARLVVMLDVDLIVAMREIDLL